MAVTALIAAGVILYYQVGGPDVARQASDRVYIDIATGKTFTYTIKEGDMEPIKAPSGGLTGYRAETCYWGKDADGRWIIKDEPTYVVWKKRIDPETTEETLCPDCGRRVVGHNPKPRQEDIDRANEGLEQDDTDVREDNRR